MMIGLMQVSIAHDSDLLYYQGSLHNYSGLQAWTSHQTRLPSSKPLQRSDMIMCKP